MNTALVVKKKLKCAIRVSGLEPETKIYYDSTSPTPAKNFGYMRFRLYNSVCSCRIFTSALGKGMVRSQIHCNKSARGLENPWHLLYF
jgi:hypothetical protein